MAESDSEPKRLTLDEGLKVAMELHQSGRLTEARVTYKSILNAAPRHPGALHYLGLLTYQTGDHAEGIRLIRQAVETMPEYADAHNNLGNIYRLEKDISQAKQAYEQVIALVPDHADALNNLAGIYKQQEDFETAIDTYRRAAAAAPEYADIQYNLGNLLRLTGQFDESLAILQRTTELDPKHGPAYHATGKVLEALERDEEARAAHERAVELNSDDAENHVALGDSLRASGLLDDAIASFRRALAIKPDYNAVYERIAVLLYAQKKLDEELEILQEWIQIQPDNPVAQHMLSSVTGKSAPQRASDDYVQHVFDDFSATFDKQLQKLGYQAPQLLSELFQERAMSQRRDLDILDAGCGTGLCGPLLRPFAKRLVGVDLSAGMLDGARERGGYDELQQAELTAYLARCDAQFDVIVSADTLVYFGDLAEVIRAASGALRAPGYLAFTVEIAPSDTAAGFQLNPHGRYSHTQAYLEQVLGEAGFTNMTIREVVLRQENQKDVTGWLVGADRTG